MNILAAAESVLDQTGAPMSVKDLHAAMVAGGTWQGEQKSVEARLASDIKHRGDALPFVRTAARTFGLRKWPAAAPLSGTPAKPAGTMTYLDAAQRVLEAMPDHHPVVYAEITAQALAKGYIATSGLTPPRTMYVSLMTDVKRRAGRGDEPRFAQYPKGRFGLAIWQDAWADSQEWVTRFARATAGRLGCVDRLTRGRLSAK